MKYITLPFPTQDRVSEASRPEVEKAQWKIMRALCFLLSKSHARPGIVLGQCVRVLTQERSISEDARIEERRLTVDWGDKISVPQLLFELWD